MDIYFSFQAALFFSIAHIFIRRGLVESNAMTGSFISLSMTAAVLWLMFPFFAPFSALWTPVSLIFVAAGIFAPGIGRTMSYVGIEKIGVARSVPVANSSPIFASIFAVIFLAEVWVPQNIVGTLLVISGVISLSVSKPAQGPWRKLDVIYPLIGATRFRRLGDFAQGRSGLRSGSGARGRDHGGLGGALLVCFVAGSRRQIGVKAHAP